MGWKDLLARAVAAKVRGGRPSRRQLCSRAFDTLEPRVLLTHNPLAYVQTNLVANAGSAAPIIDANLVNPRGIALAPGSGPFWIVNDVTDVAVRYSGNVGGSQLVVDPLVVSIPGGAPAGTAFNGTSDFIVSSGAASGAATFLVGAGIGQISGWNINVPSPAPSSAAQTVINNPSASYQGLAVGANPSGNFIYAANFAQGRIDVFNATFQPTTLPGNFLDPSIPTGYAPFNIVNLDGRLYVAYAERDAGGQFVVGAGKGYVSVFDTSGHLLRSLVRGGASSTTNAPWGLAISPANWGLLGNRLLVGNFGDGAIQAFDLQTGALSGLLRDTQNQVIHIDGLWGLSFGNGASAGDSRALYFTAGGTQQTSGLFGAIRPDADQGQPPPITTTALDFSAPVGQNFTATVARFTDGRSGAVASEFLASIDWGDGTSSSAGTIVSNTQGGFDVRGTHRYDVPGRYVVTVTVSRSDGSVPSSDTGVATAGTTDERFLAKTYADLLRRPPDLAGLNYWVGELSHTTREGVVLRIEATQECLDLIVGDLYQALLGRAPDAAGRTFFTSHLARGGAVDDVRDAILSSQEYFVTQGQQQNQTYLDASVVDSYHVDFPLGDPTLVPTLKTRLDAGRPRSEAVDALFARTERYSGLVEGAYERLLRRDSDAPGRTFFVQNLQAGIAEQRLIAALVGSDEYYRTV